MIRPRPNARTSRGQFGGSTVWELAYLGVPSIVGITPSVEELLVSGLLRRGLFRSTGWLSDQRRIR